MLLLSAPPAEPPFSNKLLAKLPQKWQQAFNAPAQAAEGKGSMYLYKRLYHYFKPYLFRAIVAGLLTIPIGSLDAMIAMSLKPYVDAMQMTAAQAHANSFKTAMVPLFIVGFTFIQGILNYLSIYLNGWLGGKIMGDLRRDLFAKLQSLDVKYFDQTPSGLVIQGYFNDPQAINTNILNNAKQMLTRLFSSLFLMGVLITTSWQLSIIAITVLLFVLYPSTRIRKIIKSIAKKTTTLSGNILGFYTETVGGIRVVYGYNLPPQRMKRFQEFQQHLFKMTIKATQAQGWLTPSMHFISSVGIALIIWRGSAMVAAHELTTGGFVSFITAMLMLYNPIKNLGGSILTAQMSMLAAGRIFKLLDQQPAIASPPDGAKLLGPITQGLRFQDVHFAYSPEKPVLRGVTLDFPKGKTTAIVGPSGGGKSTIVNLIPRFYDVQQGAITVDGVDIRDFNLASLRNSIAIVMQDNFLFEGTLRNNLWVGDPLAGEETLWQALEKAYLTDFVKSLPAQLDTQIGERGVMLSGGQRQRLAIARAILKNAPVVILDEATSALDNQSEVIVQKAMEALMVDRTVIVIAHRLSTIRHADNIMVLEQGLVAEQGTHDTLLTQQGTYALLYNSYATAQTPEEAAPQPLPVL
jgi:ATP-binding cassette, subfamily B, bacterial MsbA